MDDIFDDIRLYLDNDSLDGNERLRVYCKMDGVEMPMRKLSPKNTQFIGKGPYTKEQKLWAARMAYREEMKRNQRVKNLYLRKNNDGRYAVRCVIDGKQQLSSVLTPAEVNMLKRGLMTERELVDRHYSSVLQNQLGQVLDQHESRGLSLKMSQKLTN